MRMSQLRLLRLIVWPHPRAPSQWIVFSGRQIDPIQIKTEWKSSEDERSEKKPSRFARQLARLRERVVETQEELKKAPPNTIRGRLWTIWSKLISQLDSREDTLRSFDAYFRTSALEPAEVGTRSIQVVYPSANSIEQIDQVVVDFTNSRKNYHARMAMLCALFLPFSVAMTILPGPNVILAYNGYRLYCHYCAYRGARSFLSVRRANDRSLFQLLPDEHSTSSASWEATFEEIGRLHDEPNFLSHVRRMRV